jgi:hypothetical protein
LGADSIVKLLENHLLLFKRLKRVHSKLDYDRPSVKVMRQLFQGAQLDLKRMFEIFKQIKPIGADQLEEINQILKEGEPQEEEKKDN